MTTVMKLLQNALDEKREQVRKLHGEIEDIIIRLLVFCDHSRTELYPWESDNGYGRQTPMVGKRCAFCGSIDLWNRGRFVKPSDIQWESGASI